MTPRPGNLHRPRVARLLPAWEAAGELTKRRRAEEAEQLASDRPHTLPTSKHLEMRQAYASTHRELEKAETPAIALVESKLEQMEGGDNKVVSLKHIVSIREAGDACYKDARIMHVGTLRLKHGRASCNTPN